MPLEYRDSLIVSSQWHLFKMLRLYTTIGMVSVLLLANLYLAKLHDWFYISVTGHISLKCLGVRHECGKKRFSGIESVVAHYNIGWLSSWLHATM